MLRGLGSRAKRKRMKETISKATLDVVLLQETKLETVDDMVVRDIWESRFKGWECLPSVGASGGVLVICDTRFASKVDSIHGIFSMSVLLDIKGRGQWWIFFVYGLNSLGCILYCGMSQVFCVVFVDCIGAWVVTSMSLDPQLKS